MKDFNITKRLRTKRSLEPLVVFRCSFSKDHYPYKNLFNFSIWIGMPNNNKKHGSYELFIHRINDQRIPRINIYDHNHRMFKERQEENQ